MIRALIKRLVDIPRVRDVLKWSAPRSATRTRGGIVQPDGGPVPVDVIMVQFGVSREAAETIAKRGI